jgi:hypothetical protein
MVDPLFMCGVLFFSRGVRADVHRDFFSAEDVLRQQAEAEIKERRITRLQSRSRERNEKKRLFSDGSLLYGGLFSSHGFFPLSAMVLGVFPGGRREAVK